MYDCSKKHLEPVRSCNECLRELVLNQGKIVSNLHDRLDYIYENMPELVSRLVEPDRQGVMEANIQRLLMEVEDKFPPTLRSNANV